MLTVACVLVRGNVPYTDEYVVRLAGMVRRNLMRPYRFVCLTDRQLPTSIETVAIDSPRPLPGWWAKLKLFDPQLGFTGRVLYLDLDTLIVGSLDEIVDFDAPLALVPPGGTFQGRHGLTVVRRFNSSVMVFDAGVAHELWLDWRPDVGSRLWGDQDWIGERRPDAAVLPEAWFPRLSAIGASGVVPAEAKVVLAKKPKPSEAALRWPWCDAIWRADGALVS